MCRAPFAWAGAAALLITSAVLPSISVAATYTFDDTDPSGLVTVSSAGVVVDSAVEPNPLKVTGEITIASWHLGSPSDNHVIPIFDGKSTISDYLLLSTTLSPTGGFLIFDATFVSDGDPGIILVPPFTVVLPPENEVDSVVLGDGPDGPAVISWVSDVEATAPEPASLFAWSMLGLCAFGYSRVRRAA